MYLGILEHIVLRSADVKTILTVLYLHRSHPILFTINQTTFACTIYLPTKCILN